MAEGRYHWSRAAPSARFFGISAVAALPWLLLFVRPMWWAWLLPFAVGLSVSLAYIELYKKMTIRAFFRGIGLFLVGRVKATNSLAKEILR